MGRKPKLLETGDVTPVRRRQPGRPEGSGLTTLDIVRALRTPRSGNAERARDIDAKASHEHPAHDTRGEGAAENTSRKRGYVKVESVKRRNMRTRRYLEKLTGVDRGGEN
jgi:hypothetical protein